METTINFAIFLSGTLGLFFLYEWGVAKLGAICDKKPTQARFKFADRAVKPNPGTTTSKNKQ